MSSKSSSIQGKYVPAILIGLGVITLYVVFRFQSPILEFSIAIIGYGLVIAGIGWMMWDNWMAGRPPKQTQIDGKPAMEYLIPMVVDRLTILRHRRPFFFQKMYTTDEGVWLPKPIPLFYVTFSRYETNPQLNFIQYQSITKLTVQRNALMQMRPTCMLQTRTEDTFYFAFFSNAHQQIFVETLQKHGVSIA